jgi:hypothetical protein
MRMAISPKNKLQLESINAQHHANSPPPSPTNSTSNAAADNGDSVFSLPRRSRASSVQLNETPAPAVSFNCVIGVALCFFSCVLNTLQAAVAPPAPVQIAVPVPVFVPAPAPAPVKPTRDSIDRTSLAFAIKMKAPRTSLGTVSLQPPLTGGNTAVSTVAAPVANPVIAHAAPSPVAQAPSAPHAHSTPPPVPPRPGRLRTSLITHIDSGEQVSAPVHEAVSASSSARHSSTSADDMALQASSFSSSSLADRQPYTSPKLRLMQSRLSASRHGTSDHPSDDQVTALRTSETIAEANEQEPQFEHPTQFLLDRQEWLSSRPTSQVSLKLEWDESFSGPGQGQEPAQPVPPNRPLLMGSPFSSTEELTEEPKSARAYSESPQPIIDDDLNVPGQPRPRPRSMSPRPTRVTRLAMTARTSSAGGPPPTPSASQLSQQPGQRRTSRVSVMSFDQAMNDLEAIVTESTYI